MRREESGSTMLFGRKKHGIANLLIVEDEPLIAFDNEHFLRDEGYRIVATVDRVADAVAHLSSGAAIELVILDISLSDGSGLEVAREAHARGVAVLFATANCPVEAMTYAHGCLAKPYPQRDLAAAIDAIGAVLQGGATPRRLPPSFSLFPQAA